MTFLNACHEHEELPDGQNRDVIHIKPVAYQKRGVLLPNVLTYDRNLTLETAPLRTKGTVDGSMAFRPLPDDDDVWVSFGAPQTKSGVDFAKAPLSTPSLARAAQSVAYAAADYEMEWLHAGHYCSWLMRPRKGYEVPGGTLLFPVTMNGLELKGDTFLSRGGPVCHLRAPYVHDLADPLAETRPIRYEWVQVGKDLALVLSGINTKGMAQPEIDPTLVLQPDAAAGRDTTVVSVVPTRNYGIGPCLGQTGNWDIVLLGFTGVSSVPTGAVCILATLTLTQCVTGAAQAWTGQVFSIALANTAWVEGIQNNVQALAGESCWNALAADGAGGVTTAWAGSAGLSTVGTDYEAAVVGSFAGNRSDPDGTQYSIALTPARVRGWFGTPNTNHGLRINYSAVSIGGIASSDHATAAYRPQLTVVYTLPGGGGVFQSGIFVNGVIWSGIVQ